jgi:hypothetical protein
MSSLLEQQAADITLSGLGQKDGILITDTTAITGKFRIILPLTDATFTTLTGNITKNGTATVATGADYGTVTAGMTLFGKFTAITLATGKVIAYK